MFKKIIFTCLFLFIAVMGQTNAPIMTASVAMAHQQSYADLVEKLTPSVVNIRTVQEVENEAARIPFEQFDLPPNSPFKDFFDQFNKQDRKGGKQKASSLGSGFIIDKKGVVVTNNHVVEGAIDITVVLYNNKSYPAKVVGADARTDIAVLQIESDDEFKAVPFGDSDKSRVGDHVLAIGNPLGLGGSVTAGIVSARGRDINAGPYDNFIQTDASINRGNSGGPLFNLKGEVIGINTAIFSQTGGSIGIGFSIPAKQAVQTIKQLREFGTTRRGWLGVTIQMVSDEIAESLGLDEAKGALVSTVHPKGPSEKAGVEVGDIILEFDGQAIATSRHLPRIVANTDVGKDVAVVVWRQGKKTTLRVTLGELEKADIDGNNANESKNNDNDSHKTATEIPDLGLYVAPLNQELADDFGFTMQQSGLVIVDIADKSSANERGVEVGMLIMEVNQQPTKSIKDLQRIVLQAKKEGRQTVLLLIYTSDGTRFIPLKILQ